MSIESALKNSGYKVTPSRRSVGDIFQSAKQPVTLKYITSKVKGLNEATAYRTIRLFQKIGYIKEVHLGGTDSHFEITHTEKGHHHHIVCTSCNTICDIHACDSLIDRKILKKNPLFATITSHSMEFFGLCRKCTKK